LLCLIPEFEEDGNLPAGIHFARWGEVNSRFGTNAHRKKLLRGLDAALHHLKQAGCSTVYLDGSFVTAKRFPNDYDCCYDPTGVNKVMLENMFQNINPAARVLQKLKYGGEFVVSSTIETSSMSPFMKFFQTDRETGCPKGIVKISLGDLL
jgi:hypothetical protein